MLNHRRISIVSICLGLFFAPVFFSHAAEISLSPSSQTLQCGTTYPLTIMLNTQGEKVIASDIKFFLNGLTLMSVQPLSGFDSVIYKGFGISTTGPYLSNNYYYINVYQHSYISPLSGSIPIATVHVKPSPGSVIGYLTFYHLSGNTEDSNIAVGIQHGIEGYPIRYQDGLTNVVNGAYPITCPIGGGGGGATPLISDDCTLPSTLPCANDTGADDSDSYYDGTCCAPAAHGAPFCDVSDSPYTNQELNDAFQRAYSMNIINKCPITEAELEAPLIRMEMAKMMSLFTIQVIGIYPNTSKAGCDTYPDTKGLDAETKFFIKTICQLDQMGLKEDGKTPDKLFNPYQKVTRAQFGTILSRLIYGDKYNIYQGESQTYKRYEKHLKALNRDGIMKKIQNPEMIEKRARVLLMFYRIVQQHLVEKYRLVAPAHNGAVVLLQSLF